MKIGRNAPCPCGSGKKYKKCCYLKEENLSTAVSAGAAPQEPEDDEESGSLDEQELLTRVFYNLRKRLLLKKPHIKEYNQIRKLHSEIVDAMVRHYDDGKFKLKMDADRGSPSPQSRGNRVELIETGFDTGTRMGSQGFFDMVIYKSAPNLNCVTEEFIQRNRYRKPEKIEFLHSMLNSKLGLFEVTGVDGDEGYAYLREVYTGAEYKVTDVGLSGMRGYGDIYIYTRIITHHGISFGTGLSIVILKTDGFIKNHIREHKKDYNENGEFVRFTQIFNHYSKLPDRVMETNT